MYDCLGDANYEKDCCYEWCLNSFKFVGIRISSDF